jgi:hypothetical protein
MVCTLKSRPLIQLSSRQRRCPTTPACTDRCGWRPPALRPVSTTSPWSPAWTPAPAPRRIRRSRHRASGVGAGGVDRPVSQARPRAPTRSDPSAGVKVIHRVNLSCTIRRSHSCRRHTAACSGQFSGGVLIGVSNAGSIPVSACAHVGHPPCARLCQVIDTAMPFPTTGRSSGYSNSGLPGDAAGGRIRGIDQHPAPEPGRDEEARFTALQHRGDSDRLRAACRAIRPQAAPGVVGVPWAACGEDLEENLQGLAPAVACGRLPGKTVTAVVHPEGGRAATAARRWGHLPRLHDKTQCPVIREGIQ